MVDREATPEAIPEHELMSRLVSSGRQCPIEHAPPSVRARQPPSTKEVRHGQAVAIVARALSERAEQPPRLREVS